MIEQTKVTVDAAILYRNSVRHYRSLHAEKHLFPKGRQRVEINVKTGICLLNDHKHIGTRLVFIKVIWVSLL